ncbi:MAG: glycoside hydrolase family 2 TIM barrel-domain containing protein [bacterium]|nr:glycoside hydrolase family 2 TIM barrel-domain containing protein [bacterium]
MKKKKILYFLIIFVMMIIALFTFDNKFNNSNITSSLLSLFTQNSTGPRKKYNFNYNWMFAKGEGYINKESIYSSDPVETYSSVLAIENPQNISYSTIVNDNRWSKVSLSHTFNDVDTFDNFMEPGYNAERSTYTGTTWYKKEFYVPNSYQGKRIYIEFEAARQAADVYINGTKLEGKYENGFIPFGYDITDYLIYNANNDITVMVDNSYPYYMQNTLNSSNTSAIAWHNSHWHPNYGGLFRNSFLYVVDNLHLTLPLYSFLETEGTYVYTTDEDGVNQTAIVHVDSQVENYHPSQQNYTLQAKVYNANNENVLTITSDNLTLAGASCSNNIYTTERECETAGATWTPTKATINLSDTLENVIRWSTEYPYLYTVECELIQNSTVIDNNITTLGIRTFRFTSDYGFYLNENYVELNGWGQKTTMEYASLGAAYPDWLTDDIIKMMKDANANYIRWGHVAGSPSQIASADKYGMLVTQPGVDGEGTTDGSYDSNTTKLRLEAFRDLLIYYRNNPSIIMWEIGNQSTSMTTSLNSEYINSISGLNNFGKTTGTMAEIMYFLTNKYDYGNRENASSGSIPNVGTYDSTTNYSLSNRALTVRRGSSSVANYVEVAEITNGDANSGIASKPSVEAEYNRDEARRGVWDTLTNNFTSQNSYHYTSEAFAVNQVKAFYDVVTASSNMGGANWIFSDTISHGRVTSEIARASGEVDATMLEKEAYYVDQVIFNDDISSYIIGHWNYQANVTKTVYAVAKGVSNLKLIVTPTNGTPVEYMGTKSYNYLWTFANVAYQEGTISVVGYDEDNNIINSASSSKSSHGSATGIRLTLINGNEGIKANGSDVVLVDVEVVDSLGNRCLTYDPNTADLITFALSGDTNKFTWRGGYNPTVPTNTNSYSLYSEAGIVRVAIRTSLEAGTINLNASSANGLTSNTLTISSTAITNNDTTTGLTGVSSLQTTRNYSLTSLTDPGYGDGSKLGLSASPFTAHSSVLISQLSYGGDVNEDNTIKDAFSSGKQMYNDSATTFTYIPYKYLNAEYLLLPNAEGDKYVADMVVFTAKRNIDVYILRDPDVNEPTWLNEYTKVENEHVIGGNGINYEIYKKSFNKDALITIGSNVDAATDLNNGYSQIIFVKETSKVNNNTFFFEDFSDFDEESLNNGWGYFSATGTTTTVSSSNYLSSPNSLLLTDSGNNITYVQKSFAPLSKFKLRFKAYVGNVADANKWLRVWLSANPITVESDKTNVGVETYIDRNNNGVTYNGRGFTGSNIPPSTPGAVEIIQSNIAFDAWNTFEIDVDTTDFSYTVKVNSSAVSDKHYFLVRNMTYLSNVVFGSWLAGTTSEYYIDDIEIVPTIESVISNVEIDGTVLNNFTDNIFTYYVSGLSSSSQITFDKGLYYESSTISFDDSTKQLLLSITDVQGNTWNYSFYNEYDDPIFNGWDVLSSAGANHDDFTNLTVAPYILGDLDTIHLVDTSLTSMVYLQRPITPASPRYEVSIDVYVPSNNLNNQNNKIWLLNGEFIDPATKTNLGIETYFDKTYNSLNQTNEIFTRSLYNNDGIEISTLGYGLDQWHTYKITVDEEQESYNVYVDNILQYENIAYQANVTDLTHFLVGTDYSGQGEFYYTNYQFSNIYDAPLEGITYDGMIIGEFVPTTYEYNIYTEEPLTDSTNVEITYNESQVNHSITKNVTNQTVTITISDLNSQEYIYTLNILDISQMPITYQQLSDLINYIDNNYISTNYTSTSWDRLNGFITIGRNLLAQPSPLATDIAYTYYYINKNLTTLVAIEPIEFQNDVLGTTQISSDLAADLRLENILENGDYAYYNNNHTSSDVQFRSIPMKYMNATYFAFTNSLHNEDGEIKFIAKRDVSILIFKDRDAGAVNDPLYVDTGEIVTGTYIVDGEEKTVVYKVYKQDFSEGSSIALNSKYVLNNRITSFQNIIAVKDSIDVNENKFWCDITSRYNNLEDFMYSWGVYDTDDYDEVDSDWNYHAFGEKDGSIALNLISNAGGNTPAGAPFRSMSELYHQFAKMYGKFYLSYYANVPSTSDTTLNRWLRLWITNSSPGDWEPTDLATLNQTLNSGSEVKTYTLVETYLTHPSNSNYNGFGLYYRDATHTTDTVIKNNVPMNSWTSEIGYEVDVRNNNFYAYYGGYNSSNRISSTAYGFLNSQYEYADYALFGTRGSGKSNYWFRDLCITPINDDIISDITINTSSVNDYISITKDYLYSSADLTTKTLNTTQGSIYGSAPSTSTNIYKDGNVVTTYDTINTTSNTNTPYSIDHRVYYEITKNRYGITNAIEEALDLEEKYYTPESWANLVNKLNIAKDLLNEPETSPLDIDNAETELRNAISDLIKHSIFNEHFTGNIASGKNLTNLPSENIYITNSSSITLRVNMHSNIGTTHPYSTLNRVKKLVSSDVLPEGTTITLIDNSFTLPTYYHYTVSASDIIANKYEYLLTDFVKMGTNELYVNPSYYDVNTGYINISWIFIIDYSTATPKLADGQYSLKAIEEVSGEVIDMEESFYNINNTYGTTTFSASVDNEQYHNSDDINLSVLSQYTSPTINNFQIIDSQRDNKKLGIELTLLKNNIEIELPSNTKITYNNNTCFVVNNRCNLTISDTVDEMNANAILNFGINNNIEAGIYTLRVKLIMSEDGTNMGEIVSTDDVEILISDTPPVAFSVTLDNSTPNVINYGSSALLKYNFVMANSIYSDIVVSLSKKSNDNYEEVNLSNYITNTGDINVFTTNKYSIGNISTWTLNLKNNIDIGTYKLTYDLYSSSIHKSTVDKYFIVK